MLDAVTVLRSMEGEDKPLLGRRVVVYGGGNTAIDVARTAKRLGATEAIIVYRRTRDRMPAHDFEVEEALEEGIMMKWLSTIKRMDEGKLTVEKMQLDDKGFPQPTGEFETLEADSLVLALGQDVDLSLLDGVPGLEIKDGVVQVAPNMMTGHAGIFAGGDMVPSERTVTVAVGHGKKAARHIDAWLRGATYAPAEKHELASFDKLNTWYYADAPKTVRPMLEIGAPAKHVRGSAGRARRDQRALRGAALPVLRQLLRVRQLLRRLPGQRRDQARTRQALQVQLRLLQGLLASAPPNAPAAPSRWCRKRSDGRTAQKKTGRPCQPARFVCSASAGAERLQRRAGALLDRHLVGLVIALVDDDRLQHDFLRRRLLAQIAHRDLGADAALDEAVEVAAREQLAGLDQLRPLPCCR